jgi:HSP20 family protein
MSLSRHTIWSASSALPADVRHGFNRFFQQEESDNSNVVTGQWVPRVDIREEDKRFVIFADVPGIDPASIEISMEKSTLTIKGERSVEAREETGKFTRQERLHGAFHRRFALPESADADGISATGKHGVLEISIPKKAETSPRRITINAAH